MTEKFIAETFSRAIPSHDHNRPWESSHDDLRNSQAIVRQILQRSIQEQIRDRAYELYVHRGCRAGTELQDWLDAEFEMLSNR